MAAQKHTARSLSPHRRNCRIESLLVAFCTATLWWPMWSQLARGQIATEDGQSRGTERTRQSHEKRRIAVCSRAVRQDEAIPIRTGRLVQEALNGYFIRRSIKKISKIGHPQDLSHPMAGIISQLQYAGSREIIGPVREKPYSLQIDTPASGGPPDPAQDCFKKPAAGGPAIC
jgi:hypothetical protein